MWIVIIIIIAIVIFGFIRGSKLSEGTFKVVNKSGVSFYMGNYHDCIRQAKAQNDYCRAFQNDDKYEVVKTDF